ncbi:MAG: GNAT family N-acetyltransferase [Candidatus Thorarchaeota archaeon]
MNIRKMLQQDIAFSIELTSSEGWGSIELDFEELLSFDPEGCFIAEIDDTPIGMICTTPYGSFGFVSNLIVSKAYRTKNRGTLLMSHALDYLNKRGVRTQMLDGVLRAVSMYERFGFAKTYKSLRLQGHVEPNESDDVRRMTRSDIDEVERFDTEFFGAIRRDFIDSRLRNFPSLCKVLEIEGCIAGYIMGSERYDFIRIGPWVMNTHLERAEDLLQAFASECGERLLHIGVLENNLGALRILKRHGFIQKSFSWRMRRGDLGNWTFSDHLYAIHSAARG